MQDGRIVAVDQCMIRETETSSQSEKEPVASIPYSRPSFSAFAGMSLQTVSMTTNRQKSHSGLGSAFSSLKCIPISHDLCQNHSVRDYMMVLMTSSRYVENVVVMIPFLQVNETSSMHAMQLYPPGLINRLRYASRPIRVAAAGTSASKETPWRTELFALEGIAICNVDTEYPCRKLYYTASDIHTRVDLSDARLNRRKAT